MGSAQLEQETEGLIRSWAQYDAAMLRDYLVRDVEDPRINVQSILTRHVLIEQLFGSSFLALQAEEVRFAAVMNWLLTLLRSKPGPDDWLALLDALERGADNAEGQEIPPYISEAFRALPTTMDGIEIPNYLQAFLSDDSADYKLRFAELKDLSGTLWVRALSNRERQAGCLPYPVLEAACGSANDYRYIEQFGLAKFIDYTGFDLCKKNIENARAMFPGRHFVVANMFSLPAADKAFDFCLTHDLLEHLSIGGMTVAVREICRVTSQCMCIAFFSMAELPEHVVRKVDDYHVNTLSAERMRELFQSHGASVQIIHIDSFLQTAFKSISTHNPNAYTLVARFG